MIASRDSANYLAAIARTAESINELSPATYRLKQSIDSADAALTKIRAEVRKLDEQKKRFSIREVWSHIDLTLMIVVGLVLLGTLLSWISFARFVREIVKRA